MCILVVDDEAILLLELCDYIEGLGYDTLEAHNGMDAFKLIEANTHIKAVITDMRMPKCTGVGLLEAVGNLNKRIPCLLHSSDTSYQSANMEISDLAKVEKLFPFAKFHKKEIGDLAYVKKFLTEIQN